MSRSQPRTKRFFDDNSISQSRFQRRSCASNAFTATEDSPTSISVLSDDVFRRSAEIGYWLGEPYWGLGIATQALRALTAFAFEQFDLVRIDAGVFEWNPASCRVLETAGYVREARLRRSVYKDGQLIDRLIYARLRD